MEEVKQYIHITYDFFSYSESLHLSAPSFRTALFPGEVHFMIKAATYLGSATWWCGPQPRLGWVEMAVGLLEGSSYPGHFPETIFSPCCPLYDRRKAAQISKSVACLLSPARLRLFILLLLLMSGNIHPNPGPIFLRSVCAGNVS